MRPVPSGCVLSGTVAMGMMGCIWHLYVRLHKDSHGYGMMRYLFYVAPNSNPKQVQIISMPQDSRPALN
jgi:hypothetical protein